MEDKRISEQESLQIIQQMIATAKKEQEDDGKHWIIWGWLLLAASVLTVFNMRYNWFDGFFFWNLFGVFAFLLLLWDNVRPFISGRRPRMRSYTADLFKKLNAGFFISLMFIIFVLNVGTRQVNARYGVFDDTFVRLGFSLLINLYGFWILIYGTGLNFKPSVVGAYLTWAIGFASLFLAKNIQHIMWFHALAALVGYIIPGHLAYREFRKSHQTRVK